MGFHQFYKDSFFPDFETISSNQGTIYELYPVAKILVSKAEFKLANVLPPKVGGNFASLALSLGHAFV